LFTSSANYKQLIFKSNELFLNSYSSSILPS
jgi:hypothetical protein